MRMFLLSASLLASLLAACGQKSVQQPASQPSQPAKTTAAPPPPSTGKEMPEVPPGKKLPTKVEARAMLDKVLAAAKAPNHDCQELISPWTRVLLAVVDPSDAEMRKSMPAYVALGRCAEKQKYYVLLRDIGAHLLHADPRKGHPELLARAYIGLNDFAAALKFLDLAAKALPKDSDVALTRAKVACRMREWKMCLAYADKTVKVAKADKQVLNRAHKYRARAFLHLGKLADASKAIALSEKLGGDAEDLDEVRKAIVPAKAAQAVVEVEHAPVVALGVFHLMGKRAGSKPLVRVFIDNFGADRQFRAEAAITGVTSVQSKTETVLKGKSAIVDLVPPLAPEFDLVSVRTVKQAQLDIKVSSDDKAMLQDNETIDLQPRDFLPTASYVDEEKRMSQNLFVYMGAWVTPNSKSVEAFLSEAKQRAPRKTFAGEQTATLPQVQAIYETLKAKGFSYVMNPEMLSGTGYGQRTRLPSDVLASTNAQCLEGAIVYAALMEAIGLRPAIVVVPGHAFVGWRATVADGSALKDKYVFLETTMTHDASFDAAVKTGVKEFDEAFKAKKATVLQLADLRREGITPQPYD